MSWTRKTMTTAVLTLALFAVGGCDSGEETPTPTESMTTQQTTEPVTTAAPTPPEVEAPTPAPEALVDDHIGAIYATRYFLDVYVYMLQTGEISQFEAMSGDDCRFCDNSINRATELHEAGQWLEGGEFVFDLEAATAEYPTAQEPSYLVRFEVVEEPGVVRGTDGTVEDREGNMYLTVVAAQYVDGRFVINGVNAE